MMVKRTRLGTFFDAALVQLGWWACVLAAADGRYLLGPAIVGLLLVVQTWGLPADARRRAWTGILLLGAAGTVIDSLLGVLGILDFRGASLAGLAPLWIIALWLQFATVLPAFAPLRSRPLVAGLLGAVGGPLAYAGGVRLGAAGFHPEPWISLLAIGAVWAVAFPSMLRVLVPAPEGRSRTSLPGAPSPSEA